MKYFYVSILLLMNVCVAWGQHVITLSTGDTTSGVFSQPPTRNIDYANNSIIVTYVFDKATIMEDPLYDGRFMWNYVGFGINDISTQPAIPFRLDSFTIPQGCYPTVELVDSQYVDLRFAVSPSRPPLIDSGDESYTISNVPVITPYDGYYPTSVASLDGIDVYRGNGIANVLVSPLKYNYQTNSVRVYTRIGYKVTFNQENHIMGNSLIQPIVDSDDAFLSNVTLNVQRQYDRSVQNNPTPSRKGYLILSTLKFKTAIERFAEWKKLLGFNVQTIYGISWTPSSIKSTISNLFNDRNNLQYLMIVGDVDDVPPDTYYFDHPYMTDLHYACLDGYNDNIPDLMYGRIPVKTNAEANIVIDKIINYEKNPTNDSSFYMTGLHCAYFQDIQPQYTYEDRRFVLTSEEVRNCMMNEGYNVTRVYATQDTVNPMYWNDVYFSYGEPIPDELKRPNFTWSGDSTAINAAINNGSFYVLHRDHGNYLRWGTPSYTIDNINNLNNCNKLPVVFSMNCHTGAFYADESDCFCEAFLKKENGGCVAIYGATNKSFSGYNDVLTEAMFDAIWPSSNLRPTFPIAGNNTGGITPTPTYELGQILNQGMARLTEVYGMRDTLIYTKGIFHCFGDPSMKIYTAVPRPFTDVDIIRSADSIYVNLNGDTATIVFQNLLTGETLCATGTSSTLQANYSTRIRVCISSHNRIPYICDVDPYVVYIQNENVLGPANYSAENIKIGTNVTNTKPQGPVVFESGNISLKAKRNLLEGTTTVNKGTRLTLINKQ